MNKLVIIGNGFDLAHGLKTSYKDFILWYVNKKFENRDKHDDNDLISISSQRIYQDFKSLEDFFKIIGSYLEVNYKDKFFTKMLNQLKHTDLKWVDIEKEYFDQILIEIGSILKSDYVREVKDIDIRGVFKLNSSLSIIKNELALYLNTIKNKGVNKYIENLLREILAEDFTPNQEVMFLNFNYTATIEEYKGIFDSDKCTVNYIHGNLHDENNPIIFGYGDESNEYFDKIEKLNNNELTRHLKSFSYLTTSNYQNLFRFLDQPNRRFRVYILGHSLGLSDRLLFNHIFEHEKLKKVQLYFYEYENEKGDVVNDFFVKTQELSRHFKLDSKHAMRTKVVPFSESKPLTKFKPQN